ncbi:MAG: bifunctional [glutamate--ammonia ligase]-adenylyl-L-tyrosine phosphorylase/[glutamate--ammonia-ligase] adenylyltransferase [Halothiobacillaceae bacterium]
MFMTLETLRHDATETLAELESSGRLPELSVNDRALWLSVLSASPFVALAISRDRDLVTDLWESGDLERAYEAEQMHRRLAGLVASIDDEGGLARVLRRFRRREMVRIAWRDLTGRSETSETLRDLSGLADCCVEQALRWHERRLLGRHGTPRDAEGVPQELVVLGMGKLGGCELNYSSDIDLIFTFESEGETDGDRALSNSQFFIRLGQRLIRSLNDVTEDGFVFRVDMRLRPYGDEGPLAMSFDGMELYYATQGREWERYALIKARVIAGDQAAGQRLMDMLRPFVFRRYLDYGAFAQLRDMKQMIEREMARKGMRDNIKLGPGGIREIEFIGQLFQLIRGGREPRLQARGILPVLHSLVVLGELPQSVVDDLVEGYDFLRRSENRLQMMHDQQTQTLPEEEADRLRLAMAMGFEQGWDAYMTALDAHRQRIHRHFGDVMRVPDERAGSDDHDPLEALWNDSLDRAEAERALAAAGFRQPEKALQVIATWRSERSHQEGGAARTRLDALMPALLRTVGSSSAPEAALPRVLELVSRVVRRSVYIALLVEQPQALQQLVRLCACSPWIAELLAQHPILLDELIDPHALYEPPDRNVLVEQLAQVIEKCDGDPEREMDELRRFRQLAVLRVAAADVSEALPVMKVSDHLSWIAEVILERVLALAWSQLERRHGRPSAVKDGQRFEPGFAIIAYGKLGGLELGYGSDLDLVFLHDSEGEEAYTDGDKSIDNSLFFARVAQKVIHLLNTRTQAGILYEVDTRLRPDGASGLLVSSMRAFEDYQRHHAWTWEVQALVRARFVAGEQRIAERFSTIRREMLCRPRAPEDLRSEVGQMRGKMRAEDKAPPAGLFHLKKGCGGITDIEFIVQYLLLAHAAEYPELVTFTDNIRQLEALSNAGVLEPEQARALIDAYRTLRDAGHEQVLKGEKALVPDDRYADHRAQVRSAWTAVFSVPPCP